MDDRTAMVVSSAMASLMLARGRSTRFQLVDSAEPLTAGPRMGCDEEEEEEDVEDVEGWAASESDISGAFFSCSSLFPAQITVYCLLDDNGAEAGRGRCSRKAFGVERELHAACPDGTGPARPDLLLGTDLDMAMGMLYLSDVAEG